MAASDATVSDRSWWRSAWWILPAGLLLAGWGLYRMHTLPAAQPSAAAATAFSAERALGHLPVLTAAPRPAGSAGHARSRAYLLAELEALGLAPHVQATTSILRFPGAPGFSAGYIQNVLVRLPGTDPTGAIAVNAHYDGASNGPAAADCGACVITLLESIRTLLAGPPLRNDLVFVFSDAEEVGDLGAHAFATQHPWMEDVRLAINYEAMGTAGPAYLYATNTDNTAVMRAYAAAAPRSPTNSFTVGIFNLLPEQRLACDLQDYLDAGRPGYGFVFTGNITPYHTELDNPDNLSPGTVQQLGNTTLTLLRHWGAADLGTIRQRQDAVFFPLWPGRLVVYPSSYSLPLALGGILLLLFVLARQSRGNRLRIRSVLVAALATALAAAGILAGVVATWYLLKRNQPALQDFLVGHWAVYEYLAGLLSLAGALGMAWILSTRRWFSGATQLAAVLLLYGLMALWLGQAYPVGNYLFGWPLLIGALVLPVLQSTRPGWRRPWVRATATLLLAVPVLLLTVPLLLGSSPLQALLIRLDATAGIPALGLAPLPGLLAVLLLTSLGRVVVADRTRPLRRRVVVLTPLVLALLFFGIAWAGTGYTEERPRPESIRYELDADRQAAQWVSGDAALGAWTRQLIAASGVDTVRSLLRDWPATFAAPAPVLDIAPPAVRVLRDTTVGRERILNLQLLPARPGSMLRVEVAAGRDLASARLNGFPFVLRNYAPAAEGRLRFNHAATPAGGIRLRLELAASDSVGLELVELRNGLPEIDLPARPPATMASPLGADATAVRVRQRF